MNTIQTNKTDIKTLKHNNFKEIVNKNIESFNLELNEVTDLIFNNTDYSLKSIDNLKELSHLYEQLYLDFLDTYKSVHLKGHILVKRYKKELTEFQIILNKELLKCEKALTLTFKKISLFNLDLNNKSDNLLTELIIQKNNITKCNDKINDILKANDKNLETSFKFKKIIVFLKRKITKLC